jgi:hypothetical protein
MSCELTPQAQRDLNEVVYQRAGVAGIVAASRLFGKYYKLLDLIGAFGVPAALRPEIVDPPHRIAVQDTLFDHLAACARQSGARSERLNHRRPSRRAAPSFALKAITAALPPKPYRPNPCPPREIALPPDQLFRIAA